MRELSWGALLCVGLLACGGGTVGGFGGAGGAGGPAGTGGETATVVVSSSAAGGANDGGASSSGSGGVGGEGGGGGMGGAGPLCPAPVCAAGTGAVNGEPDCGAIHAAFDHICGQPPAALPALQLGTTEIRLPSIDGPALECAVGCPGGVWYALLVKLPPLPHCVTADGPEGVSFETLGVANGGQPPQLCNTGGMAECMTGPQSGNGTPWLRITVNDDAAGLPDGGALVRVTVAADSCPDPVCAGGCNGDGGVAMVPPQT